MINNSGELKTSKKDIEKLTLDHYKKVLENRPMKSNELREYQKEREALCEQRILQAKQNITPDWTINDVTYVIKHLKKKKV